MKTIKKKKVKNYYFICGFLVNTVLRWPPWCLRYACTAFFPFHVQDHDLALTEDMNEVFTLLFIPQWWVLHGKTGPWELVRNCAVILSPNSGGTTTTWHCLHCFSAARIGKQLSLPYSVTHSFMCLNSFNTAILLYNISYCSHISNFFFLSALTILL